MRYLSVFTSKQPTKPIAVVDLNKPERVSVIDAIYYCDFHGGHGYISNYKNIFTAKFDRRADMGQSLADLGSVAPKPAIDTHENCQSMIVKTARVS